ncbi:MAG: UDP-N-acetyl-D-glucosamine 2-epimerase, UDP-hydrolysing [Candidatus Portnoybacteria bacterium RBG_13_40_8]|uniref:UDP-N-acetyl-D-glucosamine 2-epimerase, UDP-hydrolysing n=1 Tax=Candidatus Portnoybacteria bacterium RBG_13_40_8 TaxID=1801990 RepID=A0A1G2F297_9BACT|nr:MAG: UDP-N-acetyl-D-glucosamine 2-epimerase, UDP-hydrolysing [Candidatus Portnoybacteria bacterium RBG_13_40_8]HJX05676.1 UDP-N-acetylglucosamine 2-epimerase [Candidatus Nanoarchaeia archaeon]
MKRITYISGTRADYGLMRNTLFEIAKHPDLKLSVIATGMHLMPEFGKTLEEIKKDGFNIYEVKAVCEKDDKAVMSRIVGELIIRFTEIFKKIKPNIVLVLGDRGEMLAGAIAGTYLGIPIVHVHGGEISSTVDEHVRHAITKLAQVHLVATRDGAERIIKMGENKKNVYVVGAPGLDDIHKDLFSGKYLEKKFMLDLKRPFVIVTQHPVSHEFLDSEKQMRETVEAIRALGLQAIVTYPNADAGSGRMIKIIEEYRNFRTIKIFRNIPRKEFLSLMSYTSAIVGNSSAGIIEAASFKLPVINIGTRQEGRLRTINVIDVGYNKKGIFSAIKKAIYNKRFKNALKRCKNPYGDGKSGKRIAKILSEIKINKKLLQKKITY